MSDRNIRVRRVSGRQLDLLWEYLNSYRDIATAYNRSLQAKEYSIRKWRELAEIFNSQGDGAHKVWRGWSKYWVDFKAKLKKRAASVRFSHLRTGGGPSTEQPLSDIELKYLQILGEDFGQGLHGIQVATFAEPSESTVSVVGVQDSLISESILQLHASLHPTAEQLSQPFPSRTPPPSSQPGRSAAPLPPERTPSPSSQPGPSAAPHTPHRRRHQSTPPPPSFQPGSSATTHTPHRPRQSTPPPPSSQPGPTATVRTPRRRRLRREPLMTQEAARRALVQSSQMRAEAAMSLNRNS